MTRFAACNATRWLRRVFPGNRRPDMIAINHGQRRIIVGDVTSRFHVEHVEKSIGYARQLIDSPHFPSDLRGYRVVVQERYWEAGAQRLREIIVQF